VRDIGVRANADTPADAETARKFEAEGIGLCRTEHMFFDEDRLIVMREMIFADTPMDRAAALARLLPMQRADFVQLFEIMQGLPVCIRLFDPPLHEFLPQDREGLRDLAEALDRPCKRGHPPRRGADRGEPDAGHAGGAAGRRAAGNLRHAGAGDLRGDAGKRPPGCAGGARDHDPPCQRAARGRTGQDPDRRGCCHPFAPGPGRISTTSWA
jgi:hypothetical protein